MIPHESTNPRLYQYQRMSNESPKMPRQFTAHIPFVLGIFALAFVPINIFYLHNWNAAGWAACSSVLAFLLVATTIFVNDRLKKGLL